MLVGREDESFQTAFESPERDRACISCVFLVLLRLSTFKKIMMMIDDDIDETEEVTVCEIDRK